MGRKKSIFYEKYIYFNFPKKKQKNNFTFALTGS